MTNEKLEKGLAERGFVGIEGMDSMGECHKDNLHFVLRTDGLIIYSNIPFWTDTEYHEGSVYHAWNQEKYDRNTENVFTFKKLDKVMKQ